jgi:hypothetical protein
LNWTAPRDTEKVEIEILKIKQNLEHFVFGLFWVIYDWIGGWPMLNKTNFGRGGS